MAFFNHVIEADISANTYPEPILVKQGDSGRAIIIYPTSGGEPWPIPDGATAVVHILNPMHQSATYEAEIAETEGRQCMLFRISAEALMEAGRASMDATVTVNGVTVSTLNFMLDIEPAPASDFPIPTPGGITAEQARKIADEQIDAAKADGSWKGDKGDPGTPGLPGADGVSPVVAVSAISGGHRVTVTDADGAKSFDVLNGAKGDKGDPGEGGVTPADLEKAIEEESKSTDSKLAEIREQTGIKIRPRISFVDDDGGAEIFSTLYPWMQQKKVPYTFAISVGDVGGSSKFATWQQLQQMAQSNLVDFSCHAVNDDVMSDFTAEEMAAKYDRWRGDMAAHGLPSDASTVMYNHGSYVQSTIDAVVSNYFRLGFTVTKGINTSPFDNFHMKRVGMFPTDGSFTLAQAKAYVDQLAESGDGWLVFFTHCYYESFDLDGLTELVEYIRSKGITIDGVETVAALYAAKDEPEEPGEWEELEATETVYNTVIGKASGSAPGLKTSSSSAANCVSSYNVTPGSKIKITGTAYSQDSGSFGKYSFLRADGSLIRCDWWSEPKSGVNASFAVEKTAPAGAATVLVSGNSGQLMPKAEVWSSGGGVATKKDLDDLESRFSESITEKFRGLDLAFVDGKLHITVGGIPVGEGVEIGAPVTRYGITLNLTNCTSSNEATSAAEHSEYETTISPDEGYILNLLTVTMGGEELHPVDGVVHIESVTGEIVITASAAEGGNIDVSGIVEWYQQPVRDAYAHVESLGDGWSHHVVMSDMHYPHNYRHSIAMAKALQATGRFGKILMLGDNVDINDASLIDQIEEDGLEVGDALIVTGNHDKTASIVVEPYKRLIGDGAVYGDETNMAYYYDATAEKIRFICLDVDTKTVTEAWVRECIDTMPEGWSAIILSHFAATTPYRNGNALSATNGTTVNAAFKDAVTPYNVTGDPTRVAAWLHGHYHGDAHTHIIGLNQLTYATDCYKSRSDVAGTENEQALSILSVNPTAHEIVSYRIGYMSPGFDKVVRFNYAAQDTGWQLGWWANAGAGWASNEKAATLLPATPVTGGQAVKVYLWDDRFVSSGWAVNFYRNGKFAISHRSSGNKYIPSAHCRYVGMVNYSVPEGDGRSFVGSWNLASSVVPEGGATVQDFIDHVHITTEKPLFTDWTIDQSPWLVDHTISNGNHADKAGAIVNDKLIYCEPGQTVTITVDDDADKLIGWCYFHFYADPVMTVTKRLGTANANAKSYSYTVPAGCNYVVVAAEGLADVVDHITLSII